MIHELKTVDPFFTDIWEGRKTFEVRKLDRPFAINHLLHLQWYQPPAREDLLGLYLGRRIIAEVKHVLTWEDFPAGIKEGYGVLSIQVLRRFQGLEEVPFDRA